MRTAHAPLRPRTQWIVLGLALLLLGGVLAFGLGYVRKQIVESEFKHLGDQARIVEVNLERQFVAAAAGLGSVIRDLRVFETSDEHPELTRRLSALSDAMPGVRTLSVQDAAGAIIASNRAEVVGLNVAHRDFFQRATAQPDEDKLYIGEPFKSVLGVYSVTIARVTLTPDKKVHRVVAATLDPGFFRDLLDSVRYADDVWVATIHQQGRLILHSPELPSAFEIDLRQPHSFFSRHMGGGQPVTQRHDLAFKPDVPAWIALRTLATDQLKLSPTIVVAVGRDPHAALQGWQVMVVAGGLVWLVTVVAASVALRLRQRFRARVAGLEAEKEALRREAESEIRHMAYFDNLTHLPNRRLLMDRLVKAQAASVRHGRLGAVLYIDLDGFKQLNDQYGHDQGDRLLQEVGNRLRASLREEDTAARIGGDEFIVMLPELSTAIDEAQTFAEGVADKLRSVLAQDYLLQDLSYRCSASIGLTLFGQHAEPIDAILKRADKSMYAHKARRQGIAPDNLTVLH